jgi:ornithine carbamoyltransferase
MANTWIQAATLLDITLSLACPKGYPPNAQILAEAIRRGRARVELTLDPWQAVQGSDVVYTDVWASMGQEKERKERAKRFLDYQVNARLLNKAKRGALVMHCLPAHAGEEISAEVLEGPQSVVFDQAENRLHGQKAILEWLLKDLNRRERRERRTPSPLGGEGRGEG